MKAIHWTVLAAAVAGNTAFAVQYLSIEEAQKVMFPEATGFKPRNVQLSPEQMRQVEKLSGLAARSANWRVFGAYKDDALLGYLVLDDVVGKFELISYAVALNRDASIRQVEILAYRESHGSEIKSPAWRRQFVGKTVQSGFAIGNGIQNISGATLSCTHVTDGVRRIAAVAQVALEK